MVQAIEAYYWPTVNGHKLLIALEEMGLAYSLRAVNIRAGEQYRPEFLAVSPNRRMPAILDPDGPGGEPIPVFESGAILQYLARKSGRFGGADEVSRVEVEQWLYWQSANLGPNAGQASHYRFFAPAIVDDQRQIAYAAIRYTNEVERLFGVLERRLADRDYMAGDYSIADMATWPFAMEAEKYGVSRDAFPRVKAWAERIAARPAVRKAMELGEEILRRHPLKASDAVRKAMLRRNAA